MMQPADLYGLPLDRFTPERNALAKELRQAGQRDDAARVSKLRKPSLAAWAVNQLVRTQRRDMQSLFDAGDAAQRSQAELLEGKGEADALREAADAERQALARLIETARGLLSSQGEELSQARLEQVSETLHAAALDSETRALVKDGCLERELRHVGLGALSASAGPAARPRRAPAPRKPRERPKPALQPDGPSAAEELRAARQAKGDARRQAERAKRELRRRQERRQQAADALRIAEQELAEAHSRATQADAEHERARRHLEQLKR